MVIRGATPWHERKDSNRNGGEATRKRAGDNVGPNRKHKATNTALPSETFDWDRALSGYRKIMEEYGYA